LSLLDGPRLDGDESGSPEGGQTRQTSTMRMLVFGGTLFVSRAIAVEAVERGHEVVCAVRGLSGAVPAGAAMLRVDRDDPHGLAQFAGEVFDAVVDTSIMSHRWVADALRMLADRAGHWTFVSSISVYADRATRGLGVDAPVHPPAVVHATLADRAADPDLYGRVKVANEDAVRNTVGERAFIVRPGLVTGPGDHTDRFGYWPMRFARGGRVVVPDVSEQPTQYIDVRDLAAWVIDAGERGLAGTFDAIGPAVPLPRLLADVALAVGSDAEPVPVKPALLDHTGIAPWSGPRSLPLWLPPELQGMTDHDAHASLEAGLRVRSLTYTVAAAMAEERTRGVDRERRAGLTPADEAELLALADAAE
jgi:2'-hydroxyisoflavone reductase